MIDVDPLKEKLEQIYRDTYDDLLRYVVSKSRSSADIQDILQNTYLRLWNRMRTGAEIAEPKYYLVKIAKHELFRYYGIWSLDMLKLPVFSKRDDENYEAVEQELFLDSDAEALDLCGELWREIEKLDHLTFQIFVLYFKFDMKLHEIAKELRMGESAVKNRLYRSIKEIRRRYDENETTVQSGSGIKSAEQRGYPDPSDGCSVQG